ncbi:MAG: amino acid racemase [Candidatus Woesearchaeota archaeon]
MGKKTIPSFKTIGILGGMGPEATAEFYRRLIRQFQQQYGAQYDADYPEMIILNVPLPDVVGQATAQEQVKTILCEGVKKLEHVGAELIAVPCNTVAYYFKEMQQTTSVPILNLVQETAAKVRKSGITNVGLLGTAATIQHKIYHKALPQVTILTGDAAMQEQITTIILRIMAGKKTHADRKKLVECINTLKQQGAEKVILGCTELPLLIKNNPEVLDTLAILAEATVRQALKPEQQEP